MNKNTNLQGIIEATNKPTFDVSVCFRLCIGLLTVRQIDDEDAPRLVVVADPEAEELVTACQELAQEHHLVLKTHDTEKDVSLIDEADELCAAAIIGGNLTAADLDESTVHWFPTKLVDFDHDRLTLISKPIHLRNLFGHLASACAAATPISGSLE